jgi:O-antigen ligase
MSVTIRSVQWSKGVVGLVLSIVTGLVLASFIMISTGTAVIVLAAGIAFTLTLILRRVDFLVYGWFVLTSVVFLITARFLPEYYSFLGTAIFWGLLGCVIAAWAMDNILSGRRFVRFDNMPVKAAILVFLLWGTMSLCTSVDLVISIKRFSHIVIGLAASYMFFDFFSQDQKNIKSVLGVLSILIVTISCFTIVAAAWALARGLPIYKEITLWLRGPNALGSMLCNSIPIVITAGLPFASRKSTRFFFSAIILLALFFTFSRTAWVGTLSALAFLLWKSKANRAIWLTIIIGFVAVAWLFPIMGGDFYDYIAGQRYSGRRLLWEATWKMACDKPLLGVGPGNAQHLMGEYLSNREYARIVGIEDTHSLYLKNAAEMGFVSVVIWVAVLVMFVHNSLRIEKSLDSAFLRTVCRGATATFLGLSVHGLGENGYFMTPFVSGEFTALLPYIVFAMPFAAEKLGEKSRSGEAKMKRIVG